MDKILGLVFIGVWLAAIIGWFLNIAGIIHAIGDPSVTTLFVARCFGVVFAPLGAVLGYF